MEAITSQCWNSLLFLSVKFTTSKIFLKMLVKFEFLYISFKTETEKTSIFVLCLGESLLDPSFPNSILVSFFLPLFSPKQGMEKLKKKGGN